MQTKLNPYIGFKDNAREAMEFYKTVFGGKLEFRTFKESHAAQNPMQENNIMHAVLVAENGITIMAADMSDKEEYLSGKNIRLSLSGDNEGELKGYWDKLSDSASISVQLAKAPWGDTFGMLTDKFGIEWMVNIAAPEK